MKAPKGPWRKAPCAEGEGGKAASGRPRWKRGEADDEIGARKDAASTDDLF